MVANTPATFVVSSDDRTGVSDSGVRLCTILSDESLARSTVLQALHQSASPDIPKKLPPGVSNRELFLWDSHDPKGFGCQALSVKEIAPIAKVCALLRYSPQTCTKVFREYNVGMCVVLQ